MGRTVQVVIDCADPASLADFWAQALGYIVQPPPQGHDSWESFLTALGVPADRWNDRSAVVDPDGVGPRVFFQRVPEEKATKNRVHMDIRVAGEGPPETARARIAAEVARLTGLGAAPVASYDEMGEHWVIMRDPEGNEFCIT
jgi:hypothetical protein